MNGYYASSKFPLEGITESLWQELEPIGLRALLVEPGSFRTGRPPASVHAVTRSNGNRHWKHVTRWSPIGAAAAQS